MSPSAARQPRLRRRGPALAVALLATLGLAACAEDIGPGVYSPYTAGSVARVEEGVVVAAQPIRFRDDGATGGATAAGAVGGGIIGSQIGGSSGANAVLGVVGAVAGAAIGNAVARNANERPGFVYTIRLARDGGTIQVPQVDPYPIAQGAHVYVSFGPDGARVQPISGYAPPPTPYR